MALSSEFSESSFVKLIRQSKVFTGVGICVFPEFLLEGGLKYLESKYQVITAYPWDTVDCGELKFNINHLEQDIS